LKHEYVTDYMFNKLYVLQRLNETCINMIYLKILYSWLDAIFISH